MKTGQHDEDDRPAMPSLSFARDKSGLNVFIMEHTASLLNPRFPFKGACMKTCRILALAVLLMLLALIPVTAATYTRASQAGSPGGPHDFTGIIYYGHSAESISFRDAANGSIIVEIPANIMPNVRSAVLAYRHRPFNIRIQITSPYNQRTQGCGGSYIGHSLTPSQPGSGTVNLARSVNRTGGSTIRNVTYQSHTATSISFRDTEGNTAVAVILTHQLNDLLNQVLANRNTRYDLTLEVTHPYSAASRECRGTYRNHLVSQGSDGQQTSSAATRSGTITVNTASAITDTGNWAIRNLTYLRHTDVYFYFRDSANYAVDIAVPQNQRQTLISQIAGNPSRLYTVTMQSRGAYNQNASRIIGTYVSHTAQAADSGNAGQQGNRNIRSLSEATITGEYTIASITYVSVARGGLVYTFRDFDNNTLTLRMADVAQSDRLWDYLNSRNNPRASIRMQVTHPYNAQNRQCQGTYIAHY